LPYFQKIAVMCNPI